MTTDSIKELVKRLRIIGPTLPNDKGYSTTVPQAVAIAADTLEALAGEVERLTTNGVHTCHDQCQRPLCKSYREIVAAKKHGKLLNKMLGEAEAERDRLKAENDLFYAFCNAAWSVGGLDVDWIRLAFINPLRVYKARKALGDAS